MPDLLEHLNNNLIYKNESYKIIGTAMAVHNELGPGFLEAVYHEAMVIELEKRNIPYKSEVELPIIYKGITLKKKYKADIICYDKIAVELKAANALDSSHESQALNYLAITKFKLALLFNFGEQSLEYKRLANTR